MAFAALRRAIRRGGSGALPFWSERVGDWDARVPCPMMEVGPCDAETVSGTVDPSVAAWLVAGNYVLNLDEQGMTGPLRTVCLLNLTVMHMRCSDREVDWIQSCRRPELAMGIPASPTPGGRRRAGKHAVYESFFLSFIRLGYLEGRLSTPIVIPPSPTSHLQTDSLRWA